MFRKHISKLEIDSQSSLMSGMKHTKTYRFTVEKCARDKKIVCNVMFECSHKNFLAGSFYMYITSNKGLSYS